MLALTRRIHGSPVTVIASTCGSASSGSPPSSAGATANVRGLGSLAAPRPPGKVTGRALAASSKTPHARAIDRSAMAAFHIVVSVITSARICQGGTPGPLRGAALSSSAIARSYIRALAGLAPKLIYPRA
jgi:hypothetical protein